MDGRDVWMFMYCTTMGSKGGMMELSIVFDRVFWELLEFDFDVKREGGGAWGHL